MPRAALTRDELHRVRALLRALRGSPAVAEALAAPVSSAAVRHDRIESAGNEAFDALGGGRSRLAPVAGAVAAFRELQTRYELARATTTADLAAVVARSLDRSADPDADDRRGVTFETADGERIVVRALRDDAWKPLLPGKVGVVHLLRMRPPALIEFRVLELPEASGTAGARAQD